MCGDRTWPVPCSLSWNSQNCTVLVCCSVKDLFVSVLIIIWSLFSFISLICFYSMKTGLLKWKPDYEGASVEYGKAGKLNKVLCWMKSFLLPNSCLSLSVFWYLFYINSIIVTDSVCLMAALRFCTCSLFAVSVFVVWNFVQCWFS